MPGAVIANYKEFENNHRFLCEELLQPMSARCDVGRTTMFNSQLTQTVILDKPEIPHVFSRFENKFGSYTVGVKKLGKSATVVSFFDKAPNQRVYALRYEDGTMDIHFGKPVHHLTENYGYNLTDTIKDSVDVGSVLKAGTVLHNWSATDEYGNFKYGRNVKTLYSNKDGLTYEDAIIISKSCANSFSHTSVEEVFVVMNANDLTVNTYGTTDVHKGFPDVGEEIVDRILAARRRINHETILHDLSERQLSKINMASDTCFFAEGTVVDIDVYSNMSAVELDKHPYNRQILQYHNKWLEFQKWMLETFNVDDGENAPYSDDVGYWFRVCRDMVEGESKWRYEHSEFDGVVLKFTIAKSKPIRVGSKVANRYGGKGVISEVREDHLMPHGVDMFINSLGVVNRLNVSQLYESELNFIAMGVADQMTEMSLEDAHKHLMYFYEKACSYQFKELSEADPELVMAMVAEVQRKEHPIYINQPPFFGIVSLECLNHLYEHYGIERVHVEDMEELQVVGMNYYIKLRHEPESKMSARSAKYLTIGGVPAKNNRGLRASTEHHSTTPVRLGEQELQNLMIANQPTELSRMLRMYATDEKCREATIEALLSRADPFSDEPIDLPKDGFSHPVAGFKAMLGAISLELVDDEEDNDVPTYTSTMTEQELPDDVTLQENKPVGND